MFKIKCKGPYPYAVALFWDTYFVMSKDDTVFIFDQTDDVRTIVSPDAALEELDIGNR